MKKIYTLVLFVLIYGLANAQFPSPYCPEAYSTNVEPITYVRFGSIANVSPNTTAGTPHEDYTSMSTDVTQGLSYTIKVSGNTDGNYSDYVSVFIDWNQDSDFDDAGETYKIGIITNSDGLDTTIGVTATITVPVTATLGNTRFRVAKHWNSYQNPCNTSGYGEAEDYTVNVLASPACTGAPPVAVASGPSSACIDSLITLSISGITAGTGLEYKWEASAIGANSWSSVSGATSAIVTIPLPAGGRDYRCVLKCTSSGQSSNSNIVTVTAYSCAPPPNDDPCDAMTLVLDGPSDCQNTKYATSANDPTSFSCSTPNNTTWYKYTPTVTGPVQFTFKVPDTLGLSGWLGVFTASGSCPGSLTFTNVTTTVLGACTSFGTDTITKFTANLDAGTEYYFMVDGVSGAIGSYCISIQTPPAPPATCATNISPADNSTGISAPVAVIKWTSVAAATTYDIYFGTVNPPTTKIGTSSIDSIQVTGLSYSTTYYWYVVPKNTGGSPTGCDANTTSFTTDAAPPPPSNDECDSAINVNAGVVVNGTTISATQSMAGQTCSGFTGTADDDVWFMFTATQSGDADITLVPVGTSFDAVVIAYSGTCGSLTQIGCADTSFGGGTEIVHLTGLNAGETYYFRVYSYSSSTTTGPGTFKISIAGGAVLPVTLVSFKGEKTSGGNLLSWATTLEQNNKGFELQKSYDGVNFLPLTFIESKAKNGNSSSQTSYQFRDSKPFAGVTYYRLKQVDLNGKFNFSNTISIKGEKISGISISELYPNPANTNLKVIISSQETITTNLVVTDITGKNILTRNINIATGNNLFTINVSGLASGTYFVKTVSANGNVSKVNKFVKN